MKYRTSVFVDGYNLYYGRLKGTPFKWLDLVDFSNALLKHRSQNEVLTRVVLCTAHASATFSQRGKNAVESQAKYLRALSARHNEKIDIIYGKHTWSKNGTAMPRFESSVPFNREDTVSVWKIEEKMTDVNLALSIYRECSKGQCDRLIIISNDTDIAPAMQAIKQDFPQITCGVLFPIKPPTHTNNTRRKSGTLENLADWFISYIEDDSLANAQMPEKVNVIGKKTIVKPNYW